MSQPPPPLIFDNVCAKCYVSKFSQNCDNFPKRARKKNCCEWKMDDFCVREFADGVDCNANGMIISVVEFFYVIFYYQ